MKLGTDFLNDFFLRPQIYPTFLDLPRPAVNGIIPFRLHIWVGSAIEAGDEFVGKVSSIGSASISATFSAVCSKFRPSAAFWQVR
jgi:hypothetical protein